MRKLSLEEIKNRIKEKGLAIEIMSTEYKSIHSKLLCKCLIDGYKWEAIGSNISRGHGCPRCGDRSVAEKRASNFSDVKKEILKTNPAIEILSSDYKNNRTKLKCLCKVCGNEWQANSNNLLMKKGCPRCANKETALKQMLTLQDIINRLNTINKNIIILSHKYEGFYKKIKVKCKICEHIWNATPSNLTKGHGCPKCNSSKGERAVEQWLNGNNIKYKTQYRINECRFKKPLPFDFAVFNNDMLLCLIEYQGIQHFKVDTYYGGEGAFRYTNNNDAIKKKYCEENNIKLIEIPYTIKNIAQFLKEKI